MKKSYDLNNLKKILTLSILILLCVTPFVALELKALAFLIISLFGYLRSRKQVKKISVAVFLTFVFLIIIGVANDLIRLGDTEIKFPIYFFISVFSGLLLSQTYSAKDLIDANEIMVSKLIIISFGIHALTLVFPQVLDFGWNYTYDGTTRKTLLFANFAFESGYYTKRFNYIAWEAGAAAFLLALALARRLEKYSKFDIISLVIIIAIFGTRSTAGLIMLFCVLLLYIKLNIKSILLVFLGIAITYPLIIEDINYHANEKIGNQDYVEGRYGRYEVTIEEFDLPDYVFGKGNKYYDDNYKFQNLGHWDSWGQMLQRYGLLAVLLVLLFILKSNLAWIYKILLVMIFGSQSLWLTPLAVMVYFSQNKEDYK